MIDGSTDRACAARMDVWERGMATVLTATSGLFRDRDFFVHDGTQLRRFRLSASIQIVAFTVLFALVAWSSYAVVGCVSPSSSRKT